MWDVIYWSLKTSIECFFFPLLFSSYFRSANPRAVSFVFGGFNQSSAVLFYVVLQLLYRSINYLFIAGKSSSFLFFWHIVCQHHLWDARPNIWSLVFLFSSPFFKILLWSTSRMVPSNLWRDSLCIYPFDKVPIIIIYTLQVFHITISWWSFTRVWVRVSLLKFPGLFSVFWPFSIMQ